MDYGLQVVVRQPWQLVVQRLIEELTAQGLAVSSVHDLSGTRERLFGLAVPAQDAEGALSGPQRAECNGLFGADGCRCSTRLTGGRGQRLLDGLEERRRTCQRARGRHNPVQITPQGHAALDTVWDIALATNDLTDAGLTTDESTQLNQLLLKIIHTTQGTPLDGFYEQHRSSC